MSDKPSALTADIAVHCSYRERVDVTDLKPHPRNYNRHPDSQVALLATNIRTLGWRHPVLVSRRSGYIVAGHARVEAARLLGMAMVPVDYQDFATEDEELAYLMADNRIAELAERDAAAIKDLLEQLDAGQTTDTGQLIADLTGYDAAERERLATQFFTNDETADADKSAEAAMVTCPKCNFRWHK